jgi:hypothetical protein
MTPTSMAPKLTKQGFGGFGTMLPASFWQSTPETPKQLDTVDEPDTGYALQGLAVYGWRRPRQLRRLDGAFLPPGRGPLGHDCYDVSA